MGIKSKKISGTTMTLGDRFSLIGDALDSGADFRSVYVKGKDFASNQIFFEVLWWGENRWAKSAVSDDDVNEYYSSQKVEVEWQQLDDAIDQIVEDFY